MEMIKNFIPVFTECADIMIESLKTLENKQEVDILKVTSRCSLSAILATSFGLLPKEVEFSDDILKAVEE